MHQEQQYIDLVNDILTNGCVEQGRNGDTISVFGRTMRFSLANGVIPILTTKKTAWKTCLKELLWFISGSTDNRVLCEQGVHIWDGNAGDHHDLGPIYGHQWRHFNAPYETCDTDYTGKGVDQLQRIIDMLRDPLQRTSRRLILSAWNPSQLDEMALPPCHAFVQFYVRNDMLSCCLYQRSGDVGLGIPFNIASYSFLTHLLAHHTGLVAHEFVHVIGDAHIYKGHEDALREQCTRKPFPFPTVRICNKKEQIEEYTLDDFVVESYQCHGVIQMKMVV
jgi:thymidylate synthase